MNRERAVGPRTQPGGADAVDRGRSLRPTGSGDPGRGSASLWALAVGLLLLTAGLAGASVGAARVARHQARTAADLGALAGAYRAGDGAAGACARASELVAANGARLTSCALDGFDIEISATVAVAPLPGLVRRAAATARAGPVRLPEEP